MKLSQEDSSGLTHRSVHAEQPPDSSTGLPWPRTWSGVYFFVIGCFVMWVALLVVLERVFS
jgi:hypothetical protein